MGPRKPCIGFPNLAHNIAGSRTEGQKAPPTAKPAVIHKRKTIQGAVLFSRCVLARAHLCVPADVWECDCVCARVCARGSVRLSPRARARVCAHVQCIARAGRVEN